MEKTFLGTTHSFLPSNTNNKYLYSAFVKIKRCSTNSVLPVSKGFVHIAPMFEVSCIRYHIYTCYNHKKSVYRQNANEQSRDLKNTRVCARVKKGTLYTRIVTCKHTSYILVQEINGCEYYCEINIAINSGLQEKVQ